MAETLQPLLTLVATLERLETPLSKILSITVYPLRFADPIVVLVDEAELLRLEQLPGEARNEHVSAPRPDGKRVRFCTLTRDGVVFRSNETVGADASR